MATPSQEETPRRLIEIMAELRGGATCESLRREFEAQTGLARQCFYNNFKLARQWGWIIGGGGRDELYELNPAAPWKASASIGAKVGVSEAEQTRLECLVDIQAGRIEELESDVERIRGGEHGVALESLVRIVSDNTATARQRVRAAGVILGYRVTNDVAAFARRYLESVCENAEIPVDYQVQAAETLRRAAGDAMLRPSIEKLTPPSPPRDREAEEAERRIVSERRRKHLEEQSAKDQERLRQEWKEHGWTWPTA
jgi:hypothetical protein